MGSPTREQVATKVAANVRDCALRVQGGGEEIDHRPDCYEIEPGKFCDCPTFNQNLLAGCSEKVTDAVMALLEAAPSCPHVETGAEGTSFCRLAEGPQASPYSVTERDEREALELELFQLRERYAEMDPGDADHICQALLEVGGWDEIDGDGTDASIIADHIRRLPRVLAERARSAPQPILSPALAELLAQADDVVGEDPVRRAFRTGDAVAAHREAWQLVGRLRDALREELVDSGTPEYTPPPEAPAPQPNVLTGLEADIVRSVGVRITENDDLGEADRARMTGLLMIIDRLCPVVVIEDTETPA